MKLTGWRHTTSWTYLVMLIASASALLVSFVLSAETLQLARHPGAALACDVNSVISCSTVANSWQSEFIRVGALSFPNAFFGIAAESVFVTVAVMGLVRITFPRWFAVYPVCVCYSGIMPMVLRSASFKLAAVYGSLACNFCCSRDTSQE